MMHERKGWVNRPIFGYFLLSQRNRAGTPWKTSVNDCKRRVWRQTHHDLVMAVGDKDGSVALLSLLAVARGQEGKKMPTLCRRRRRKACSTVEHVVDPCY